MKKLFMSVLIAVVAAAAICSANSGVWQQGGITASGLGVAPADAQSVRQARVLARRAAIVDAYRNLGELAEGVRVDSETLVKDAMIESDVITSRMTAVIKNAVIVSEAANSDGTYQVTMNMPLFGENSLASAVFEENKQLLPFSPPSVTPDTAPGGDIPTGLVIDCRGLDLQPVMSPVIYDESGRPIYGYENLDYKKVIALGMASYETDITAQQRAGGNPLIIKAVSLSGHNANPVVTPADAELILSENARGRFLENLYVVFLM